MHAVMELLALQPSRAKLRSQGTLRKACGVGGPRYRGDGAVLRADFYNVILRNQIGNQLINT